MKRNQGIAAATVSSRGTVVAMKRAHRAADLWTTIETAEFAYVILCDDPAAGRDERLINGFRRTFATVAEQWNRGGTDNKAPVLATLQTAMDTLTAGGIQIYWACVVCSLSRQSEEKLSLPLALLHLDPLDADEMEITLSESLVAEIPRGESSDDFDDED